MEAVASHPHKEKRFVSYSTQLLRVFPWKHDLGLSRCPMKKTGHISYPNCPTDDLVRCQTNRDNVEKSVGWQYGARGFSLMELLISITVISVLAAIVVVVARGALTKADSIKCISNLRNDGMAITSYASDNNGKFMANPNPSVQPGAPSWWMSKIAPYLNYSARPVKSQSWDSLKCPSYPETPKWQTYMVNGWLYNSQYGIEYLHQITEPSETIVLYDSYDGYVVRSDIYTIPDSVRWDAHEEGAHFLMADGSVRTFSPTSSVATDFNNPHWQPVK